MVTGTFIFLMIVLIAICVILTLVILSQNPKGGGLSSTFGGSGGGQMFGVQRTNNFLDKATWTLAAIIAAVVILANVMLPRTGGQGLTPDIPLIDQTLPPADLGDEATAPSTDATATDNEATIPVDPAASNENTEATE